MSLGTPVPIYVTRKTANGQTGAFSLSVWIPLLILLIFSLNAVGWGIYSLVLLARTAF